MFFFGDRAALAEDARICGEFWHGAVSTGARNSRWQGCQCCPQVCGFHAGKVANAVHRCADSTLARMRNSAAAEWIRAETAVFGRCGLESGPSSVVAGHVTPMSNWRPPCERRDSYRPSAHRPGAQRPGAQRPGAHRPGGASCGATVRSGHPNFGKSSEENSLKFPKFPKPARFGPFPARNPSVTARSEAGPRGTHVTDEVTATRRFEVLQMSWQGSRVPLHLVATRV